MSISIRVDFDADEAGRFAEELGVIQHRVEHDIQDDLKSTVKSFTAKWRAAAAKSSGKHGRLYPLAIKPEFTGELEAVIGPLSSMRQGGMGQGFEYGTPRRIGKPNPIGGPFRRAGGGWWGGGALGQRVGQDKPHLDMNKTADVEFPALVKKVTATVIKDFR